MKRASTVPLANAAITESSIAHRKRHARLSPSLLGIVLAATLAIALIGTAAATATPTFKGTGKVTGTSGVVKWEHSLTPAEKIECAKDSSSTGEITSNSEVGHLRVIFTSCVGTAGDGTETCSQLGWRLRGRNHHRHAQGPTRLGGQIRSAVGSWHVYHSGSRHRVYGSRRDVSHEGDVDRQSGG